MQRGRPKTKPLTVFKKLEIKYKVRLDRNTIVYVRDLNTVKEVWRPLYPDLKVTKIKKGRGIGMPDIRSSRVGKSTKQGERSARSLRPRKLAG